MREIKCVINGVEITIQISDEDFVKAFVPKIEAAPITGWERVAAGDTFYYLNKYSEICSGTEDNTSTINHLYEIANYTNQEVLSKAMAHRQILTNKLIRFAAEHWEGPEPNWGNDGSVWHISVENDGLLTPRRLDTRYDDEGFGEIYFHDAPTCQKAIYQFEDELKRYYYEWDGVNAFV